MLSLSHSWLRWGGVSHCPDPLPVAPKVSWVLGRMIFGRRTTAGVKW